MGSYIYTYIFFSKRDKVSADDVAGTSFLHIIQISQLSDRGILDCLRRNKYR
jgi:hypothetical protein